MSTEFCCAFSEWSCGAGLFFIWQEFIFFGTSICLSTQLSFLSACKTTVGQQMEEQTNGQIADYTCLHKRKGKHFKLNVFCIGINSIKHSIQKVSNLKNKGLEVCYCSTMTILGGCLHSQHSLHLIRQKFNMVWSYFQFSMNSSGPDKISDYTVS